MAPPQPNSRIRDGVTVAVTGVWVVSFLADIAPQLDYSPSPFVHAAFLVVLGFLFGFRVTKKGDDE